jgi:hypothetical protein
VKIIPENAQWVINPWQLSCASVFCLACVLVFAYCVWAARSANNDNQRESDVDQSIRLRIAGMKYQIEAEEKRFMEADRLQTEAYYQLRDDAKRLLGDE